MKKLMLAGGAALAMLATADIASAHTVTIACNASDGHLIDVSLSEFPAGPVDVVTYRDGTEVDRRFGANGQVLTIPVADDASVFVRATGTDGQPFGFTFYKDCLAPEELPPPVPVPPAVTIPPPLTPIGPPRTPPRKAVPPRTPPRGKITCGYLNRIGAGPREYHKRGWTFRCRVTPRKPPPPKPTPPPRQPRFPNVPVTG